MKRAILNEQYLNGYIINEHAPIGTIMQFAKNCPNGSVNCNGQSLSRTNYNRLFAIIGTTYGADDEATFKVPLITNKAELNVEYMTGERYIDGKPIYKKIIDVRNNGLGVTGFSINVSDLNIAYLVDSNALGSGYNNYGGNKWVISCVTASGTRELYLEGATQNLRGKSNEYIHFASIKYTKTTDTENTFCYNQLAGSNFCIKATDYTQATEDILDDSKVTTGNVLSAAKVVEMNSYSTEEIKTEYRWVDNRHIYVKVFVDPNNSWTLRDNIIGSIENLKEPISIKAIAFNDTGLGGWVENNEGGDARCYAYIKSNGEVHFYRNDIRDGVAYPKKVIIKYTKTTE